MTTPKHTDALPALTEQQWAATLLLLNNYASSVADAALHESASKADIAQSAALSALRAIRQHVEQLMGQATAAALASRAEGVEPVAGWRLVPTEPTPGMLQALKNAYKEGDFWRERIHGAVAAMLSAAPSHPAAQGSGEREAFEAWLRTDADFEPSYLYRRDMAGSARIGQYCQGVIEYQWQAWQERAARASSPSQADGWQPIDKPPALPDDDSEVPVWTWDGEFVSEDEYGGVWEQPAGPAVGGWVRVGDGFLSDTAGRVTHWRPRVKPNPPAAPAAAQSDGA